MSFRLLSSRIHHLGLVSSRKWVDGALRLATHALLVAIVSSLLFSCLFYSTETKQKVMSLIQSLHKLLSVSTQVAPVCPGEEYNGSRYAFPIYVVRRGKTKTQSSAAVFTANVRKVGLQALGEFCNRPPSRKRHRKLHVTRLYTTVTVAGQIMFSFQSNHSLVHIHRYPHSCKITCY